MCCNFFFQSAANIGNYLEYQNFQYDQWRYILKVLYKKVGLFQEAMNLQMKEVLIDQAEDQSDSQWSVFRSWQGQQPAIEPY